MAKHGMVFFNVSRALKYYYARSKSISEFAAVTLFASLCFASLCFALLYFHVNDLPYDIKRIFSLLSRSNRAALRDRNTEIRVLRERFHFSRSRLKIGSDSSRVIYDNVGNAIY